MNRVYLINMNADFPLSFFILFFLQVRNNLTIKTHLRWN